MQKITTCLWFDDRGEEAMEFYVDVLGGDSRIERVQPSLPAVPGLPADSGRADRPLVVYGTLAGHRVMALNGGAQSFGFNEAVSLSAECADQAEVDRLWTALTADGGEEGECGWLKDRYGLSWQIVPSRLPELLAHPDREVANRVMTAMLGMRRLDVRALEDAAKG
ncbi:VOC family protein [Streptomyces sp. XM4193]|uniref:VOC family protein n=1 Tax=Streptomyces sp. XM4193 TaxID=2929782 RepID=UPI001FF89E02|nr:VOC family protein [Streptomyces sp. XM4193]MCK1795170.1 VOC family protein [Streptomyces sp. XM4193]